MQALFLRAQNGYFSLHRELAVLCHLGDVLPDSSWMPQVWPGGRHLLGCSWQGLTPASPSLPEVLMWAGQVWDTGQQISTCCHLCVQTQALHFAFVTFLSPGGLSKQGDQHTMQRSVSPGAEAPSFPSPYPEREAMRMGNATQTVTRRKGHGLLCFWQSRKQALARSSLIG